ncbi:hypothetical protein TRAPUB_3718 [Trametes pubescens]|uniref:Fungal-type protein kinase domain-containing protein n=1 Tax=Trametes pubescens TaxID=154538 RepID=A0A1M2VD05_TRAPU|nr:hypothetical protein TRAPUB_3718 [Trametes pubescens]
MTNCQEMSARTQAGREPEVPHLDRDRGTWQFMSVAALQDPRKEISLPDEMESVFNVLLYCAIRYLPHNCKDVGKFIQSYFDDCEFANIEHTEFTSGMLKTRVIETGRLCTSNHIPIIFLQAPLQVPPAVRITSPSVAGPSDAPHRAPLDPCITAPSSLSEPKGRPVPAPVSSQGGRHPIDHILQELLSLFKAFYEYQQPPQPQLKPLKMSKSTQEMLERFFGRPAKDSELLKPPELDPSKPSQESVVLQARLALEKKAKKLTTHNEVANILHWAIYKGASYWLDEDKQDDQLYPVRAPVRAPDKDVVRLEEDVAKPGKRIAPHEGTFEGEPGRKRACAGSMSST